MRIAEIYVSRQGEGLLTGTPSVFVRTSGCNLRCWLCDTPYTSWEPEGEDWSVEEVVSQTQRLGASPTGQSLAHPVRHVVITGGEPMLFAELIPLCDRLHAAGLHITIETAGTLFLPVHCDLMSISPKLPGSTPAVERAGRWHERHERTRHQPEVTRRLLAAYNYQLKFVIDAPTDLHDVQTWLAEFPEARRDRVLLMPQGTDIAHLDRVGAWLEPEATRLGFRYCPRMHIAWYGARRGT